MSRSGRGITVIVDRGPFADRLDGYESKRGFERRVQRISGEDATVVRFLTDDGSTIVGGARFTETPSHAALTFVVHVDREHDGDLADRVIQTIELVTEEGNG